MEYRCTVKFSLILLVFIILGTVETSYASANLHYEIIEAADQRDASASVFDRALAGNNLQYQRQALLALGRIGDKTGTLKITPFLFSKQPDIRAMAAFALGINKDLQAHNLLAMQLTSEQHPVVLSRLLVAIGNLGDAAGAIRAILPYLNHKNDAVVSAACDGLTLAWTFHRDRVSVPNSTQVNKLLQLSEKNDAVTEHCLFTLTRLRREPALFDSLQLMRVADKLATTNSKILVLRIIAAMKNPAFSQYIISSSQPGNSPRIRAEAAAAIALLEYQDNLLATIKLLANDDNSLVKVSLIDNLTVTDSDSAIIEVLEKLLEDKSRWVRQRATLALFAVKASTLQPVFLKLLTDKEFQSQQLALQIMQTYQMPEQQTYLATLSQSKHQGIRKVAQRLLQNQDTATADLNPQKKSVSAQQALQMASKKMVILTSRGPITIQLMTATAFTSANFYQLAVSGYYNGLSFHRVIANFVAQGGDPEGTGLGNTGFSIREELYPTEHSRGTLGMASSGKDTAGGQFFFNNSDNFHLNSNYTVFARIIHGVELIDLLQAGDSIISVTEIP